MPALHRQSGVTLCLRSIAVVVAGCFALVLPGGCRSPLSFAKLGASSDDDPSIGDVKGPLERRVSADQWDRERRRMAERGQILEGLEEYEAAEGLYKAGEYRAAETAFKALVKARRRDGVTWGSRWEQFFVGETARKKPFGEIGDPIEEDAMFMLAECQFAQQEYSWAQDSFGELLEKYPSTRHLDQATRRLFRVAQYWLEFPVNAGEAEDLKLAKNEAGQPEWDGPARGPANWPLVPNVADRTRPVFDTHGRAVQALEWIWRYDATGPLADDALMLSATYHQRKGDNIEAARLYKLVRDQYPDSSHLRDAYLLGSHVTLASYSGPSYDGKTLHESKQLKETTRRLFPDLSAEQRQRLEAELAGVSAAEIEREWANVQFYQRKNQPESVALYCHKIINKYPDSEFAQRAREILKRQEQPTSGWPLAGLSRSNLASARSESRSDPSALAKPSDAPAPERRSFFYNPLRRASRTPALEPIENSDAAADQDADPGRTTLDLSE